MHGAERATDCWVRQEGHFVVVFQILCGCICRGSNTTVRELVGATGRDNCQDSFASDRRHGLEQLLAVLALGEVARDTDQALRPSLVDAIPVVLLVGQVTAARASF